MVEALSPIAPLYVPGEHGNIADGVGVVLTETRPGSIAQVAAWPGKTAGLLAAIAKVTGLKLPDGAGAGMHEDGKSAFGFAPGRFLIADQAEGLVERLADAIGSDIGTVTGLSHGRTVFRIAGNGDATEGRHKVDSAEWVLGKLFALDFALAAFPLGAGRATLHHDIHAMIQRVGENAFDVYVFSSFARSFWKTLCHAAEEIGYEVR